MTRIVLTILLIVLAGCGIISRPDLTQQAVVKQSEAACKSRLDRSLQSYADMGLSPENLATVDASEQRGYVDCMAVSATATPGSGTTDIVVGPAGMGGVVTFVTPQGY